MYYIYSLNMEASNHEMITEVASQELVAVDALLPKAGEVGSRDAIFGV